MKTKVILTVSILLASGIFNSCKKKSTVAETPAAVTPVVTPLTQSFSAKVGGVIFNETILSAIVSQSKIFIVASANNSFPSIGINMPQNIAAGTYSFNSYLGGERIGLYNTANNTNSLYGTAANTGSLVITSNNTTAKQLIGTFSFVAVPNIGNTSTNSYSITEGSFAVNY
jgi:hypothetical protein